MDPLFRAQNGLKPLYMPKWPFWTLFAKIGGFKPKRAKITNPGAFRAKSAKIPENGHFEPFFDI